MNFQIETTSFCNLTCPECPNRIMQRKRQFMSDEVWHTIAAKYVLAFRHRRMLNAPTVIPHKDGEPFLDKKLFSRLDYLAIHAPDLHFSLYSNGLVLTRQHLERLGSYPNPIRLLLTYHFHNHDGSENDYSKLTTLLRDCLDNYLPRNVQIFLASHLVPPVTEDRLITWHQSWQPYTDRITVTVNQHINPWTGLIAGNIRHNKCVYDDFGTMFFGVTGNVIACCMDLEEKIVFGNVLDQDPEFMYGSVQAFYEAQKRREVNHTVCHNCFGIDNLIQIGRKVP